MATISHNTTIVTPQIADIRACTARVSAFRARVWPAKKPANLPLSPPPTPITIHPDSRVKIRQVIEVAAKHFGIDASDLTSASLKQPLTRRRQIAIYIACEITGRAQLYVASKFNRDNSTVIYARRSIKAAIDSGDVDTIAAVNAIVEQLTGGANV